MIVSTAVRVLDTRQRPELDEQLNETHTVGDPLEGLLEE
jgi:hypothetical protein